MTKRINENQIVKILDEAKTGMMKIEETMSQAWYFNVNLLQQERQVCWDDVNRY